MKYLLLLVLGCSLSFNGGIGLLHSIEDHYWRDYNGIVSNDALPGGKNENDQITYIGQMNIVPECSGTTYAIHTIPVTITNGNLTAVGAYREKTVTSTSESNVKVLCSRNHRSYSWYTPPTLLKPSCRFVVVGFEDSVPLYVGRALHNKQTIIGKIFSDGSRHYTGLIIAYQGTEYLPEIYGILSYCE